MVKYLLQLENFKFVLCFYSIFLLIIPQGSLETSDKFGVNLEDLIFYEKIITDFYSEGRSRELAIQVLDTRCRWRDPSQGLSCSNLAILYKNIGDLSRAYTAAAYAFKKEPQNSYYRNLFQNLALQSGNIRDMEKRLGDEGLIFILYKRAINECNLGNPGRALSDVLILVSDKHLTKEQFERGLFYECFKDDKIILNELKKISISNQIEYSKLLEEEENRFNPYREIWDLNYHRKELNGELGDMDIPESNLTRSWIELKQAIKDNNISKAKKSLMLVREFISEWKKTGDKNKIIAESLELAIELILTQYSEFRKLGSLVE